MNRPTCKGCKHLKSVSGKSPDTAKVCHYLIDTGTPRGCSADNCIRYEKKTNQRATVQADESYNETR